MPALYVLGDSTAAGQTRVPTIQGWGVPFQAYFDPSKIYLRKFVTDIRSKGATPVILTLTIRDRWNKDGSIERVPEPGLDLSNTNRFTAPSIYSVWSAEVARSLHVPAIDVHNMIADRYDKEGPGIVSTYFNSPRDPTHRNPLGAEVDAAITLAGLKALRGPGFDAFLSEKGKAIPAAEARYLFRNGDPLTKPSGQD